MIENISIENRNEKKDFENFMYNDKCSLVLIIDKKSKNDKSKNVKNEIIKNNDENKAIGNGDKNEIIRNDDKDKVIKDNGHVFNKSDDIHKRDNELIKMVDRLNKDNVSKDDKKSFKESIKLHIGFDYSTFEMNNHYKIIKFINKGSHFLYWSNDTLFNDNEKITKEFKMNEMKKNNCEEIRNSRFIYFDNTNKLLVLKYDIKNNNFTYLREDDNIYKYFLKLHEKDFLDNYILKEEKSSILIYPYTYTKLWRSLTSYINDEIINKIEPVNKTFSSSFLNDEQDKSNLDKEEEMDLYSQPYMFYSVIPKYPSNKTYRKKKEDNVEQEIEGNNNIKHEEKKEDNVEQEKQEDKNTEQGKEEYNYIKKEENNINNGNIINQSYFECISIENESKKYIPSELTLMNLEKYWILKEIIEQEYAYIYYDNEKIESFNKYENKFFYILGEFQFSFILFHLGFNYQSFLQWKKLFELFCNSQQLITNFSSFYEEVLNVISVHLTYLSDDFFDNTENSFILFGIYSIYEIINNLENVGEKITNLMSSIDSTIYTKIGLHLPDLSFVYEEFQPAYVDED